MARCSDQCISTEHRQANTHVLAPCQVSTYRKGKQIMPSDSYEARRWHSSMVQSLWCNMWLQAEADFVGVAVPVLALESRKGTMGLMLLELRLRPPSERPRCTVLALRAARSVRDVPGHSEVRGSHLAPVSEPMPGSPYSAHRCSELQASPKHLNSFVAMWAFTSFDLPYSIPQRQTQQKWTTPKPSAESVLQTPSSRDRLRDGWKMHSTSMFLIAFIVLLHGLLSHLSVAQNLGARVTQVLVLGSIYQGAVLVHVFEPQPFVAALFLQIVSRFQRAWQSLLLSACSCRRVLSHERPRQNAQPRRTAIDCIQQRKSMASRPPHPNGQCPTDLPNHHVALAPEMHSQGA